MKRIVLVWLLAAVSALAQPVVDPQKAGMDPQRLAQIAQRMEEFEKQGQVPGTVTLLQRHGVIAHFEATGFADLAAKKPMRTDTIFQIMSMTKPVTGICIMMLADEGKLRINDPVERYIPEFHGQKLATGEAPTRPITIRDLMMHTSGMMGNPPASTGPQMRTMNMPLGQAVALYGKESLRFEPGTRWSYSTVGIDTLGRIVEVVSGLKYEEFLAKRIFEPLGMVDSYVFLPAAKRARLADVYTMKDGKMVRGGASLIGGDPLNYREGAVYPGPGFGMYSTALDLSKLYEMMLRKGVY
jgi:CubicO group peptidase (beta-lactamase class C family)